MMPDFDSIPKGLSMSVDFEKQEVYTMGSRFTHYIQGRPIVTVTMWGEEVELRDVNRWAEELLPVYQWHMLDRLRAHYAS